MMQATFWGVRGSIPAPGLATMRYGGNTACVSVRIADGSNKKSESVVIFDCGTGARLLGNALMNGPFGKGKGEAVMLLSISQWDHIQGFPFFRPFYIAGNRFTIYGSTSDPKDLESVLEFQMAAQYFPVQTIKNMTAQIELAAVPSEGITVGTAHLRGALSRSGPHGASAFRLEHDGRVLVYAGHAGYPGNNPSAETIEFYKNADLLIHECSLTPEDGRRYSERGLASLDQALECAIAANAKKLALFHYDQDYTDHEIDTLLARARQMAGERKSALEIVAAAENETLDV